MIDKYISEINKDIKYFGNEGKKERELYVGKKWADFNNIRNVNIVLRDKPDLIINGELVEVTELLEDGRKRHDEIKRIKEETLRTGKIVPYILNKNGTPKITGLQLIKNNILNWLIKAIEKKQKKYGEECKEWILLIYCNVPFTSRIDWDNIKIKLRQNNYKFKNIDILMESKNNIMVVRI